MYILNFCIKTFQSASKSVSSFFVPTTTTTTTTEGGEKSTNESTPLVNNNGESTTTFDDESSTVDPFGEDELGLAAEFTSWADSSDAFMQLGLYVLLFFSIAVIGYSFVFENWHPADSFYFTVVIFTTVGYGDFSPTNDASRLFTIFIALFGITILGILLGIVGEHLIDRQQKKVEDRIENARKKVMEQFSPNDSAKHTEERTLLKDAYDIFKAELPILLLLGLLGAPVIYLEGWDLVMGIYWMFITGTTVGFGDLGPTTTFTRLVSIIYIPIAVAVFGEFLGRVAGAYIERKNDAAEHKFLSHAMTLGDLRRMDSNHDEVVSPGEFLQYMLVALQKVDQEDIDEIMDLFHKLDQSKTGSINKEDLIAQYNLNVKPGVTVYANQSAAPLTE